MRNLAEQAANAAADNADGGSPPANGGDDNADTAGRNSAVTIEAIVLAETLAPLVKMLGDASAVAAEQSALALRSVAASGSELRNEIVEAGALKPLVVLLSHSAKAPAAAAAAALRVLSQPGEEKDAAREKRCTAMLQLGAVPPLAALLADSPSGTAEHAACALYNLAELLLGDIIGQRQQLLAACAAARTLAAHGAAFRNSFSDAGVLQALVQLTSGAAMEDDELHAACWGALTSLVTVNLNNVLSVKSQGLKDHVKRVSSRNGASPACRHAASRLLKALVSDKPFIALVIRANIAY